MKALPAYLLNEWTEVVTLPWDLGYGRLIVTPFIYPLEKAHVDKVCLPDPPPPHARCIILSFLFRLLGSAPLQAPFSQRGPGSKIRPFSSPAPILSVSFPPAMNISKLSAGKLPVKLIPIKLIHKGLCDVFVPFPKSLPHAEGWAMGLAKFTLSIRSPKPRYSRFRRGGEKHGFSNKKFKKAKRGSPFTYPSDKSIIRYFLSNYYV